MHDHFMKHYGCYLKEHYSDLENMTKSDLCEAKEIAKTMKAIFDADTQYNIVKSMEEHDDSDIEMTWDEFESRFRKMYNEADPNMRNTMKLRITSML